MSLAGAAFERLAVDLADEIDHDEVAALGLGALGARRERPSAARRCSRSGLVDLGVGDSAVRRSSLSPRVGEFDRRQDFERHRVGEIDLALDHLLDGSLSSIGSVTCGSSRTQLAARRSVTIWASPRWTARSSASCHQRGGRASCASDVRRAPCRGGSRACAPAARAASTSVVDLARRCPWPGSRRLKSRFRPSFNVSTVCMFCRFDVSEISLVVHSPTPGAARDWCGRRDSNPHIFRYRDLNPARLPVPPRPPGSVEPHRDRPSGAAYIMGFRRGTTQNSPACGYAGSRPSAQIDE